MHINIKPNSTVSSDRGAIPIEPPLSIEEFQDEIQALEKACSGELMAFRPDDNWLVEVGHRLFQRARISCDSVSEPLVLDIEPALMDLPWEFLHDGSRFYCLKPWHSALHQP